MNKRTALTYDDIQLIPKISSVLTRKDIDLSTMLSRNYGLLIPIVASPMDTVCEYSMAYRMYLMGGVGCIHRFMPVVQQCEIVDGLHNSIHDYMENGDVVNQFAKGIMEKWGSVLTPIPIAAAIGVQEEDKTRALNLVKAGACVLVVDVAHGHHIKVYDMIKWCKSNLPEYVDIIGGNITTSEAAEYLMDAGVDGLRVGIGGGSLCTTRMKTGFGVPNVTALEDICSVAKVPVIADGGIRNSGDISKALSLGASSVMLGSLLSGTQESPGSLIETNKGLYKRYRGSASLETKLEHNQVIRNIEGESTTVPFKGGAQFVINGLLDGVRSALSYGGAESLSQFHPDYNIVTASGLIEGRPHLIE